MHRSPAPLGVPIRNTLTRPINRFKMLLVRFWAASIPVMLLIKCVTAGSLPQLLRMSFEPEVAFLEILLALH